MTHRPIEDLIRDADSDQREVLASSESLWTRVEASLDKRSTPVVAADKASNVSMQLSDHREALGKLHVAHRAGRLRLYRLLSIAATLILLLGAGWWLASEQEHDSSGLQSLVGTSASDRSQLEGALELEGARSPILSRGLYDGIVVKTGDQDISALRVCSPC